MMKSKPEDFVVKEIIDLKECSGKYLYVEVEKKGWNTLDVVKKLCSIVKIPRKNIGYAGYKDKNALTTQYFSLFNVDENKIRNLKIKDVKFKIMFYGDRPISVGSLRGNEFKIIVRDIERRDLKINFLENYFDEQRFGKNLNNHLVGESLLKRDFKEAIKIVNNERLNTYLEKNKNDCVGALKLLDFKMIKFYISTFQSYLFNQALSELLKGNKCFKLKYPLGDFLFLRKRLKNFKIPLVNFDYKFGEDKISLVYKKLLDDIEAKDFIFREFPYSVSNTVYRDAFVDVKKFKYKYEGNNVILEFSLPKGSYGTLLVKKLFPETYIN